MIFPKYKGNESILLTISRKENMFLLSLGVLIRTYLPLGRTLTLTILFFPLFLVLCIYTLYFLSILEKKSTCKQFFHFPNPDQLHSDDTYSFVTIYIYMGSYLLLSLFVSISFKLSLVVYVLYRSNNYLIQNNKCSFIIIKLLLLGCSLFLIVPYYFH